MKRFLVALLVGFSLVVTLGTVAAWAGGPPNSIVVDPDDGVVVFLFHTDTYPGFAVVLPGSGLREYLPYDGAAPPDLLVKTPQGPRPPAGIPPGTY